MTKYRTLFFSVASGDYEAFAAPFAASALAHNDDIAVELVIDDMADYERCYRDAIGILTDFFPQRVFFRDDRPSGLTGPKARFLMEPSHRADYVYISDVDILILEKNITVTHIKKMNESGLPYSNIQRPNKRRLSGLHFTKWERYYPIEEIDPEFVRDRSDEAILYELMRLRGLLPAPNLGRPVHGIHMSPNRDTVVRTEGVMSWGVTPDLWQKYQRFAATDLWTLLRPHFGRSYNALLERLEVDCGRAFGLSRTSFGR